MSCGTSTSVTPGSWRIFEASSEAVRCVASRFEPLIWMSIGVGRPRFSTESTRPPDWKKAVMCGRSLRMRSRARLMYS